MAREDIPRERALKLYDLALSVVRAKGRIIVEGSESVVKFRHGLLDSTGQAAGSLTYGSTARCFPFTAPDVRRSSCTTYRATGSWI